MRTTFTILSIVLACALAAIGAFVVLWILVGFLMATVIALTAIAAVWTAYVQVIRPWHSRWGATDDEIARPMPGDELITDPASTTRAITISAPADHVWPWLVQIGYGRAGWYSYDWIDNDGRPSAEKIMSDFQNLRVGDRIEMLPGMGPEVTELKRNRCLLAGDANGGTWCMALYPIDDLHTRLVSRWRQSWNTSSLAAKFWVLIADPGAFIMEQKMLRGIKKRAEAELMRTLIPIA